MLSLLKNLFSKTAEKSFHPGIFRNPLAEKVSWEPQKSGGANYRNRSLVKGDNQKLLYKSTPIAYFFSFLFMIGPLVFLGFYFFVDEARGWKKAIEFPFVLIIPIIFGTGAITLYNAYKPISLRYLIKN